MVGVQGLRGARRLEERGGGRAPLPGTYGVVITTGHFTRAAIAEADRPDRAQTNPGANQNVG